MNSLRAVCVLTLLSTALVGCDDDKPAQTSPPKSKSAPAKAKAKAKTKPRASAPASASAAKPTTKAPEQLAERPGLGKVIALHEDYVYWTVQPGSTCTGADCKSASDGSIWRIPKKGGVPKEVVGSLYDVTSLAFNAERVFWTMCGSVDFVQRCQITSAPQNGGKRSVLHEAGPDLVQDVVWAGTRAIWAEPSNKRLQQSDGKQEKPSVFVEAGEVTDVVAHGQAVYWSEGRVLSPDGSINRAALQDPEPKQVASKREAPRHLVLDDNHAYWTEAATVDGGKPSQVIVRVEVTGGDPKPVVKDLSYVDGLAVSGDRIAFATNEAIAWAPKAGGKPQLLASGLKAPHGPAADDTHVYWIADNKIWRLELPE